MPVWIRVGTSGDIPWNTMIDLDPYLYHIGSVFCQKTPYCIVEPWIGHSYYHDIIAHFNINLILIKVKNKIILINLNTFFISIFRSKLRFFYNYWKPLCSFLSSITVHMPHKVMGYNSIPVLFSFRAIDLSYHTGQ